MSNDVILEFYIASVKVQSHELHLCNSAISEGAYAQILRETENARRELGAAMCQLLNSAIPSRLRKSRLFRTKYTEEVDLRNLEKCLVSAANKVIAFDVVSAPRDLDLRPAQPSASELLDYLSEVQSLILNQIESALTTAEEAIQSLQADDMLPDTTESTSTASQQPNPTPVRSLPTVSDKSNEDSPGGSPSTFGSPKPIELPRVSQLIPTSTRSRYACTSATIRVTVGTLIHTECIRLPPPSLLCVSDELLSLLLLLDEAAANFEYEFVRSFSRRMRTPRQANDVQLLAVLFSETLMWSLAVRLLTVQQLADRDPSVMLSLPRLVILIGTRLLPDSPIGANRLAAGRRLPFVFAASRSDLAFLARQLNALRLDQLCRLARWLGPRGLPNLVSAQLCKPPCDNTPQSPPLSSSCTGIAHADSLLSNSIGTTASPEYSTSLSEDTPQKPSHTWRTCLPGLHRIYKRISTVADEFCTKYPTEFRFILQACFEMHDTSNQDAALAEMEGRDLLEEDVELLDESQTSETEVECEVPVNEDTSGKHFSSLVPLFDWTGVMGNRDSKEHLSEALRNCCTYFESKVKPKVQLSPDAVTIHEHTKMTCQLSSPLMELGVDVISWLNDTDTYASCRSIELDSIVCGSRDKPTRSAGPSIPESTGSGSLQAHLAKLTLGIPVEGMIDQNNSLLHYLPAWQPNHLSPSALGDTQDLIDSDDGDVDADSDSISDEEQAPTFIVGRQCASCLLTFNLFRRRHHCRRCGHIFCSRCCNHWETVEGLATTKPVRICVECHDFMNCKFI